MILTFTPGEGDVQRWEIQLGRFRVGEMKAIDKATGLRFGSTFKQALLEGDTSARQALLWVLQRRQHPTLKLDDVDFADDELTLEFQRPELVEILAGLESAPGIPEDQREAAAAAIRAQLAELDDEPDDAEGKAPASSSSATSTG